MSLAKLVIAAMDLHTFLSLHVSRTLSNCTKLTIRCHVVQVGAVIVWPLDGMLMSNSKGWSPKKCQGIFQSYEVAFDDSNASE